MNKENKMLKTIDIYNTKQSRQLAFQEILKKLGVTQNKKYAKLYSDELDKEILRELNVFIDANDGPNHVLGPLEATEWIQMVLGYPYGGYDGWTSELFSQLYKTAISEEAFYTTVAFDFIHIDGTTLDYDFVMELLHKCVDEDDSIGGIGRNYYRDIVVNDETGLDIFYLYRNYFKAMGEDPIFWESDILPLSPVLKDNLETLAVV